jgi:hypothetical protein
MVTFNDLPNAGRPLEGEYPAGVIDWGTSAWWLAKPLGDFSSNNLSFDGIGIERTLTFLTPRTLYTLEAYNEGPGATTVTLSCAGNPDAQVTIPPQQVAGIATLWDSPCSTVTISSSNGPRTHFDNLYFQ